jgi:hypothetical protein
MTSVRLTRRKLRAVMAEAVLVGMACVLAQPLIASTQAVAAQSPAPSTSAGSAPSAPPVVPDSGKGATFGVGPSDGRQLDHRNKFDLQVTPGARVTDHVALQNYGTTSQTLSLYATDALNSIDGTVGYLEGAAQAVDIGSWVTLGNSKRPITVPPRGLDGKPGTVIVPFTVVVPKNAQPGDHVGAILASLQGLATDKQGDKVKLDQRVATRIYVRVAGQLAPALAVTNLKLHYGGSTKLLGSDDVTVTYTLKNTGNVALGAHQLVSVRNLLGMSSTGGQLLPGAADLVGTRTAEGTAKGAKVSDVGQLLPGNSHDVTVVLPHVFAGIRVTAKVTVYPLALPGNVDPGLHVFTAKTSVWALPLFIIGAFLLLVMVIVLVRRWLRASAGRHRSAANAKPKGKHSVPVSVGGH